MRLLAALLTLTLTALAFAQPVPVQLDYDIVCVRSPGGQSIFADVYRPLAVSKGSDLVIRHPDGSIEVLAAGGDGAWADPYPSYDGQWVYATFYPDQRAVGPYKFFSDAGADCWRVKVAAHPDGTHDKVNLTAAVQYDLDRTTCPWADDPLTKTPPAGKVSLGFKRFCVQPCPLPGGKVAFVSSHKGFVPHRNGVQFPALQLCTINEDGTGLDVIGYINIGTALHPFCLQDGRIMFSSMESQGIRDKRMWGLWSIWPDGRKFGPLVSAFATGSAFHFATQTFNQDIVVEGYYNGNDYGAGALYRRPLTVPGGFPTGEFGGGDLNDPRNVRLKAEINSFVQMRFTAPQWTALTTFASWKDNPSPKDSAGVYTGKVTTPGTAPDGHLLCSWSPGPVCANMPPGQPVVLPSFGVYLLRNGDPIDHPNQMQPLIPSDPAWNYLQPRALVPYMRLTGLAQPKILPTNPNDGSLQPALPAGTTKGMFGSSSTEASAYPNGKVYPGERMERFNGVPPTDVTKGLGPKDSTNYYTQGSVGGLFTTDDLVAIRLVKQLPSEYRNYGSDTRFSQLVGRRFVSHANEVMACLGEVPIRHFTNGKQALEAGADPNDPKARKDTSWEAVVPSNSATTFQAVTKKGNAAIHAGTWRQVRPGERRNDCGGCHSHDIPPIQFDGTAASQAGYPLLDLTTKTPLLTSKVQDQWGRQLNDADDTGLRFAAGPVCPDFGTDIRPILAAKCVTCHGGATPAGGLALDVMADELVPSLGVKVPGDYFRLAWDATGKYAKFQPEAGFRRGSRYVMMLNSMGSLLNWKAWNERTDGFANGVRGDGVDFGQGCTAHAVLTDDQKRLLGLWIDLGCLYRIPGS